MPKRRRQLLNMPKKVKTTNKEESPTKPEREVRAARGRLMGALLDVLEGESSDESVDVPAKKERYNDDNESTDDDSQKEKIQRESYVLKLFDRSVDLSQFNEDSPLYPICRAWIANQPKADYSKFGRQLPPITPREDGVELPGPEGPVVSRIPPLLPEQEARDKDNISLDYSETPPPPLDTLLESHFERWSRVRRAWLTQAAKVEVRYSGSQEVLNKINVNAF